MAAQGNVQEIICNGERLWLSAGRAAYWPRERMLLVADMHLGKTAYFRAHGIQVPHGVMLQDLKRLAALMHVFDAAQLLVIGDMFHHKYNADIDLFKNWCQAHRHIKMALVPGNHDKLLKIDYEKLCLQVTGPLHVVSPLTFTHELPAALSGAFCIAGHIHPGYVMGGRARQSLRLPCFIQSPQSLVLPAFSQFTGLYTQYAIGPQDRHHVIAGDKVYTV